jgi:hypothetical protein
MRALPTPMQDRNVSCATLDSGGAPMLRVYEAVPRIQELLRSTPGDIAVLAWADGEVAAVPRSEAERPVMAGEREPIARFLPEHLPLSDQEIEDELNTGLAAARPDEYRPETSAGPASPTEADPTKWPREDERRNW